VSVSGRVRDGVRAFACARVRVRMRVVARARTCDWKRVALLIPHATRRLIAFAVCLTTSPFSTLGYLTKARFSENKLLDIKCVFWFYPRLLFEKFLLLRTQIDIVINMKSFHEKYPLLFANLNQTSIFWTGFLIKRRSNIKFHQNPSIGSPRFSKRRDGRTDTAKLIATSRNFANAPKTRYFCLG
jgi:hypothetical protein